MFITQIAREIMLFFVNNEQEKYITGSQYTRNKLLREPQFRPEVHDTKSVAMLLYASLTFLATSLLSDDNHIS